MRAGPQAAPAPLELGPGIRLLVVAIVLMAGDSAYTAFTREVLRVGPARMLWVAGPIAVLGVVKLAARLLAAAG
ncbi:MAG: hypothetical protein FJ104_17335 [Deltaproteobacteria bacterium]|nr:hypothetical protein [Deltaproteobacteria bacterium]